MIEEDRNTNRVDLKYMYNAEKVEKTKLVNEVYDEILEKCAKSADKMSIESVSPLMSPLLQSTANVNGKGTASVGDGDLTLKLYDDGSPGGLRGVKNLKDKGGAVG